MNILHIFVKQVKAHPVTIIFFIIGYFISTLILSIGLSNMINMRNSIIEKNNGIYKDSLNLNIVTSENMKLENIVDTFKDISKKSKIRVTTLSTYINNDSEEYEIIAEYFKADINSNFPIMKGRYYTSNEILGREKVVLLGKQLEGLTYQRDDKQMIKLGTEEYTVIGVAGDKNKNSTWDKTIFIPITSVPENSKINYFKSGISRLLLISDEQREASDLQSLIDNIKKIDSKSTIEPSRVEESRNIFLNVIGKNIQLVIIAGVLFLFSIINIVNLSSFWINERKVEIAIRKSFGISNLQISILLFMEFLSITLITTFLSLIFQFGLSIVVKTAFGYHLSISIENFALALIMSIISALITVIVPSIKALKISPIEALKI